MVELQRVLVAILCVMAGLVVFTTIQKVSTDESCTAISDERAAPEAIGDMPQRMAHIIARPR